MKKLGFVAVMFMVGASVAFASSLSVPWYVDNAGTSLGLNPGRGTNMAIVYLKNNTSQTLVCQIQYAAGDGTALGPPVGSDTFEIAAGASIAFRPVADDTDLASGGQESPTAGGLVPNRPRLVQTQKNGSITIRFQGSPSALQGSLVQFYAPNADGAQTTTYSYLLPPGA